MFHFKLEFLLRYRRQNEEAAMHKMAQRIREANAVETELTNLRNRSQELQTALAVDSQTLIPAPIYSLYKDHLEVLRGRTQEALQRLSKAEAQVEKQRRILVRASIDRKIIEKYKEKQKEAYLADQARRERYILDELATLAISRNPDDH